MPPRFPRLGVNKINLRAQYVMNWGYLHINMKIIEKRIFLQFKNSNLITLAPIVVWTCIWIYTLEHQIQPLCPMLSSKSFLFLKYISTLTLSELPWVTITRIYPNVICLTYVRELFLCVERISMQRNIFKNLLIAISFSFKTSSNQSENNTCIGSHDNST